MTECDIFGLALLAPTEVEEPSDSIEGLPILVCNPESSADADSYPVLSGHFGLAADSIFGIEIY